MHDVNNAPVGPERGDLMIILYALAGLQQSGDIASLRRHGQKTAGAGAERDGSVAVPGGPAGQGRYDVQARQGGAVAPWHMDLRQLPVVGDSQPLAVQGPCER